MSEELFGTIALLIGLFFGILWIAFWTFVIYKGVQKNSILLIFFGIMFTGIFWGGIWFFIFNTILKNKKNSQK